MNLDGALATREGACLTGDFAVYSPPYSAPERATGQASAKSHDIYSLAATAMFAMTGIPPNPGATHLGPEASVRKLFAGQTVCSSQPAIRELGRLLTLILAALHPDPKARPLSLGPLREAFVRWNCAFGQERRETAENSTPGAILRSLYKPRPLS